MSMIRRDPETLRIPQYQGSVISFRGKIGFAWMGVRGGDSWFLTRRDAWEQRGWRKVAESDLRNEIGSELQILHQGGFNPAKTDVIQWPNDPSTLDPDEP